MMASFVYFTNHVKIWYENYFVPRFDLAYFIFLFIGTLDKGTSLGSKYIGATIAHLNRYHFQQKKSDTALLT